MDEEKSYCRYKKTPRPEDEKKALINRLSRITGQLEGIKKMIDEDRYCGDILIQLSAAESALKSVGCNILNTHMKTCVKEKIMEGNDEVLDELMELIKRLK